MGIKLEDLAVNFRQLSWDLRVAKVIEQVGAEEDLYIVVAFPDGRFAAIHRSEIQRALESLPRMGDQTAFRSLALSELLAPFAALPVEINTTELWEAEALRKQAQSQTLVACNNGQAAGVLAAARRGSTVYRSGQTPRGESGGTAQDGVLAAESGPQGLGTGTEKRINVEIVDQDLNRLKPDEKPLQLSQTYTLIFSAADQSLPSSLLADAFLKYKWQDGESEVALTVRLESDDFTIYTDPQKLRVPRSGDSNKARFDVQAKREGPGVINALIFKDSIFVQLLTLKFTVVDGGLFKSEVSGRSFEAAFALQPRPLSLTILEGEKGFTLIMTGAVAATATLPISKEALAARIAEMRKVLQEVVYLRGAANRLVFQQGIKIPAPIRDQALKRLADVGYGMYREIFYSLDADAQLNLLGDKLRELSRSKDTLQIQIFSQHFMLPWSLLYMASDLEYDPEQIHPEWFLGLRHIVEHIPLQQVMLVTSPQMDGREGLAVSLNVNPEIDEQMGSPLVESQVDFWEAAGTRAHLVQRKTVNELVSALRATQDTHDQVIYFYCHASTKDLDEGGPDASVLVLGKNERLTLKDLKRMAPHTRLLPGEPLVFINACESAELSPLFYDGFVPYFIAKGARGVIGTECETPAVFAVEWAGRFFKRFLAGQKVGQIVLALRQEFFEQENNPLGLLYALYADGDTALLTGAAEK